MLFNALHTLKYFTYSLLPCSLLLQGQALAGGSWNDPNRVQDFFRTHLGAPQTSRHLLQHGHVISVSPKQLEAFERVIQSLGKVETMSLTEIPKYMRDGLKIKPALLLTDLEDLQNLILLPEEKGQTITLADAALMEHLTGLLKDNYTSEKSSYKSFCNLIQQFSVRLDKSFNKILEAKSSFSIVEDDASSFYVDIPLTDFLAEDHKLAENEDEVQVSGKPANDLQCFLFPSDDWQRKQILEAGAPLFLRVYFSTADGFPCVAKTGMIQLDPASIPQSSQTLGDVLKVAVGGNDLLIDLPAIQEDIRNSMANHLLLQFCLSSQKVVTKNKKMKEQISWSSLCSQFLINITKRESTMFEALVASHSALCNGPIRDEMLEMITNRKENESDEDKKKSLFVFDTDPVYLNYSSKPGGWRIMSDTYFFYDQQTKTAFIPNVKTHELVETHTPFFMFRFSHTQGYFDLYPRIGFSCYQGNPDRAPNNSAIAQFLQRENQWVGFVFANPSTKELLCLGDKVDNAFESIFGKKLPSKARQLEYKDFLKIMAKSVYHNAHSVQDYILSTSPEAANATTTEVSAADRLQAQQIGQNMKGDLEKKADDERIDVTSFILPTGVDLVPFLTKQNKFVKSDVVHEYSFYKKGDDRKYHEVKRRVITVTLEKPIDIHWMRRNITMDGQKFYSDALCQTSQIQSIIDTRADDPTHPEITTIYPEPPRGARAVLTPLK